MSDEAAQLALREDKDLSLHSAYQNETDLASHGWDVDVDEDRDSFWAEYHKIRKMLEILPDWQPSAQEVHCDHEARPPRTLFGVLFY